MHLNMWIVYIHYHFLKPTSPELVVQILQVKPNNSGSSKLSLSYSFVLFRLPTIVIKKRQTVLEMEMSLAQLIKNHYFFFPSCRRSIMAKVWPTARAIDRNNLDNEQLTSWSSSMENLCKHTRLPFIAVGLLQDLVRVINSVWLEMLVLHRCVLCFAWVCLLNTHNCITITFKIIILKT